MTHGIQSRLDEAVFGDVIVLQSGVYVGDLTIKADFVTIRGEGMFASVIKGKVNLNNRQGVVIENLTVDVSDSARDGISSGTMDSGQAVDHIFRNLIIVGSGMGNGYHAILCQAGDRVRIQNLQCRNFSHGVAIRCSYATINQVHAVDCNASSVIVKAAAGSGDVTAVTVSDVICQGTAVNRAGAVRVQARDGRIAVGVVVSNITSKNVNPVAVHVRQDDTAQVLGCRVSNVYGGIDTHGAVDLTL